MLLFPVTRLGLLAVLVALAVPVSAQPATDEQAAPTAVESPAPAPPETASRQGPLDAAEVEAFTDGFMAAYLEQVNVAGATVSVVRGGEVLFAKGYGYADVSRRTAVSPEDTLFRIGSVSKLFVWTAVMQLVDEGQLDLHTDVNEYLTDLEIPATFQRPVTLARLMTHTPGFEDRVIALFSRDAASLRPLGEILKAELPARVRPVGELAAYSNHGTGIAMHVVEEVSGLPWERYLRERVLDVLGMDSTTFAQPLPPELGDRLSKGYRFTDGRFREKSFEFIPLAPVGAASSTATDMARFVICQLQLGGSGEARVLSEKAARTMQSELLRHAPGVNPMAHGLIDMSKNGERVLGHSGDTLWFHTVLAFFPERDLGLFASFNSADANALRFYDAFVDHYFPSESPVPTPTSTPAGDVGRFTGTYRATRYSHTDLTKVGTLVGLLEIEADGPTTLVTSVRKKRRWTWVAPLEFREEHGDQVLAFREGPAGEISHAFLGDLPVWAYERVPSSERPGLHLAVLASAIGLFTIVALVWPATALVRRRREDRLPLPARLACWATSLLFLVFVGGLAATLADPMELVFGLPPALEALLWLPIVGGVLAVVSLIFGLLIWRRRRGRFLGRCAYSLVVVAFFVFLWQLWVWNLLGFRY